MRNVDVSLVESLESFIVPELSYLDSIVYRPVISCKLGTFLV